MTDLLIFPYSGTAIEALDCLGQEWNCVGFVSDDISLIGTRYHGIEVFDRGAFSRFPYAKVLAVHGSPNSFRARKDIIEELGVEESRYATVVHPKASVSRFAELGHNTLIMAGSVISANARIGNHLIILPNTVVHHDSTIGDYTLVGGGVTIAGNVNIQNNCYIGAASCVKNGLSIGEVSLIGIGATVIRSCPPNSTLVGNPAKSILK